MGARFVRASAHIYVCGADVCCSFARSCLRSCLACTFVFTFFRVCISVCTTAVRSLLRINVCVHAYVRLRTSVGRVVRSFLRGIYRSCKCDSLPYGFAYLYPCVAK